MRSHIVLPGERGPNTSRSAQVRSDRSQRPVADIQTMQQSAVMNGISTKALGVIISAAACAGLAHASDQKPLFNSVGQVLALAHSFGPDWQDGRDAGGELSWNTLKVKRFLFGKLHGIDIRLDVAGRVQSILVFDLTADDPKERMRPRKCATLPDHKKFATLLIDAIEPRHTPENLRFIQGVARLGWTPATGLLAARINSTDFVFQSFRGCKVEIAKAQAR